MSGSRSGVHAPITYVFENDGYDTDPSDTTFKNFGANATVDTFDADHSPSRNYNEGRTADEIVEQVFEGSWGVSFNLGGHAPWWLATLFGQPSTSNPAGSLYEHSYDLDNGNDPVPLRLYLPTDGFNEYVVVPGVTVNDISINQSNPDEPDVSLSMDYAREPFTASDLDPSPPAFSEDKFTNRHYELTVGGDTVGRVQDGSMSWPTGIEPISEAGSAQQVDYAVRAFEPEATYDHIVRTGQTVDFFNRFSTGDSVAVVQRWDNGATGDAEFSCEFRNEGSVPATWTETGRNDPGSDLLEELTEWAKTASAIVRNGTQTPPGTA